MATLNVAVTVRDASGLTGVGSATIETTTADPWAALDGRLNAPAVAPQRPTLLDGYQASRRPPWQVAGVHYGVGYPTATVLKNPATISMSGVSVNASQRSVIVSGANVTLDGYDFGLGGGWWISVRAANCRIIRCRVLDGPIDTTATSAPNLYVGYCVIDGRNKALGLGGLITQRHNGLTVEYCWLKNAGSDIFQVHAGTSTFTARYNLIEQAGMASGAHGDYTQFIGGPFTASIKFNTAFQQGGTTQGFMIEPDIGNDAGVVTSADVGNNTLVGKSGPNIWLAVTVPDIVETYQAHDNYFDITGVVAFMIGGIRGGPNDGSPKTVLTNNRNMVTGSVVQG